MRLLVLIFVSTLVGIAEAQHHYDDVNVVSVEHKSGKRFEAIIKVYPCLDGRVPRSRRTTGRCNDSYPQGTSAIDITTNSSQLNCQRSTQAVSYRHTFTFDMVTKDRGAHCNPGRIEVRADNGKPHIFLDEQMSVDHREYLRGRIKGRAVGHPVDVFIGHREMNAYLDGPGTKAAFADLKRESDDELKKNAANAIWGSAAHTEKLKTPEPVAQPYQQPQISTEALAPAPIGPTAYDNYGVSCLFDGTGVCYILDGNQPVETFSVCSRYTDNVDLENYRRKVIKMDKFSPLYASACAAAGGAGGGSTSAITEQTQLGSGGLY